jgi:hypothetical protein
MQQKGLTVMWQTLFQPDYLDPMKYDHRLRELAAQEIQRLLDHCGGYMQPVEIDFFTGVSNTINADPPHDPQIQDKLKKHIDDIENLYHRDKAGEFRKLWPELSFLLGD